MEPNPGSTYGTTATHTAAPAAATEPGNGGRTQVTELHDPVYVAIDHDEAPRRVRRITGGAVWSGLAVGVAVWVLLEVVLAAIDLVPLGLSGSNYEADELWWSGAASVLALFVGGLVAGAAARSHRASDGALQGVVTWAATVVGIIVLLGIGAGIGFGAFGESLSNAENQANVTPDQQQQAEDQGFVLTQDEAEESAGVAALFLGLTVIAAGAGGVAGALMSKSDDTDDRERGRTTAGTARV